MKLLNRLRTVLGLESEPIRIDGVTIRQIEQNLRRLGYSRSQSVVFVRDLKRAIGLIK